MDPIRPTVFISYSRKDQGLIHRLADDLRRAQIVPLLDTFEIITGDILREKIFRMGIPTCDLFFAYLTPHSTASRWCRAVVGASPRGAGLVRTLLGRRSV